MKDWLDHNLNEKSEDYHPHFDVDQAWDRLDRARRRRKRRPIIFWWSGTVLAIGLVIGIAYKHSAHKTLDAIGIPEKRNTLEAKSLLNKEVSTASPLMAASSEIPRSVKSSKTATYTPKNRLLPPLEKIDYAVSKNISIKIPPIRMAEKEAPELSSKAIPLLHPSNNPTITPIDLDLSIALPKWKISAFGSYGRSLSPAIVDSNQTVEPFDYWQTAIHAERWFGKLYAFSGLDFIQFNNKYELTHVETSFEWREGQLVQIIQYPDGTEEEVFDNGMVQITENTSVNAWQRYRYLSIPLGVGYRFGNNQINLGIEAMGLFSIMANQEGWGSQENPFQLTALEDLEYLKTGFSQWRTQVYLGHRLFRNVQLQYQLQVGGTTKSAYSEITGLLDRWNYIGGGIKANITIGY